MSKEQQLRTISPDDDNKSVSIATLSPDLWSLLFHHLKWAAGVKLAKTARGANDRWRRYQCDSQIGCRNVLVARHVVPQEVFDSAEEAGIKVNYTLLSHLHGISYERVEELALLPPEENWPIAVMCGDQQWLVDNIKQEDFEHLIDSNGRSVFEHLSFCGQVFEMATLFDNNYISKSALVSNYTLILENAALGGHENCLVKLRGTKNPICLVKLLHGGHLELALKLFRPEIMAKKGTPEITAINLAAAQRGHFNVCDFLEEHLGASASAVDPEWGFCQLHFAAKFGDLPRVKRLVGNTPTNNMPQDKAGMRPVHYAALGGAEETLMYLLSISGEYAASKILDNTNPLSLLVTRCHVELAKKLGDKCGFNTRLVDIRGQTLLFSTAVSGYWEGFLYLRDELSLENRPNSAGTTVLMTAFANARARFIAHYLQESPTAFKETDTLGNGIGYYLLMTNDLRATQYFLNKYDVDLKTLNKAGRCPLFALAAYTESADKSYWPFIALVARELGHRMANDWYCQPDQVGQTFQQLVMDAGYQELFPQYFEQTANIMLTH